MNKAPYHPCAPEPPNPERSQSAGSLSPPNLVHGKCTLTQEPAPPSDYLVLSILSALCFNLPIGLVAIYFSCKTRDCLRRRDFLKAHTYSQLTLTVNIFAFGVGFLTWALLLLLLARQEVRLPGFELQTVLNLTNAFNITE